MSMKKITRAEVAEHKTRTSLWIIINNRVFDVTKFMDEHPGGIEVLLENAGKDATDNFEDIGHSSDARAMSENYCIGELVDEDKRDYKDAVPYGESGEAYKSDSDSWMSSYLIPAVIAITIALIYKFFLA